MKVITETGLLAGLDVGGTKTAVLLVDRALNVVGRGVAPTNVAGSGPLVDGIHEAVIETLASMGNQNAELLAVGAGVPGMVDPLSGQVHLAVNLNLESYPLGDELASRFNAPVSLENDVRTAALGAYHWLNRGHAVRHLAFLSIGTGIAAGVVLNGRLYRGAQGMAGEIGHIQFDPGGERCACGQYGCLESIASGPAMVRQWSAGEGTAEALFAAAEEGDLEARLVIKRAAEAIARAIQILVLTYDVEKVVLGGGVMNAGAPMLEPIYAALARLGEKSTLARLLLPPQKVIAAPPESDVACWGAVFLALQSLEIPDTGS